MGICTSTAARLAKERSDLIDNQIEEERKRFKSEVKILLLGSRDSGLRTLVKQMKIVHQGGFSDVELARYRPIIYKNVLDAAQQVVLYMKKIGLECAEYSNQALAEKVLDFRLDITHSAYFPPEIAEAIHKLWKDPVMPKIMEEHSLNLCLMDSAAYFLNEVLRIGSPGYLPTETDILRAEEKSTGIIDTRFNMGQLSIHMFDVGGQRSERKKWIHSFENVTSIIFCAELSAYDEVLLEKQTQNKLVESVARFEAVVNSRWFQRTSIILLLTKIDEFKRKVPKVPLERYFPDYTGGPDINKAAKHILHMFMQTNRARLSIYPHLTQVTDTTTIRLVFSAVKETILQNALKDSGVLKWTADV